MSLEQIVKTHPQAPDVDLEALARCLEACFVCAATCTSCADACLGEDDVPELVRCVRLNLDCADVCDATGRVLSRQTAADAALIRSVLDSCIVACRACAEECERHAEHHDHCRVCAEECRRCEHACDDLLSLVA